MSGFIGVIVIVAVLFRVEFVVAGNGYGLGRVEFFPRDESKENSKKDSEDVFRWQEVLLDANGQTVVYDPPDKVRRLLEEPNPQNARQYLNWQKEKVERIIKAQQAVYELSHQNRE